MEYKSLNLELDDLSHQKGVATIAHAVYDNIDLVNDVARRGMFTKSWKEAKDAQGVYDIFFYLNHDDTQPPGKVTGVHDNESKAFTDVKFGTDTLGRDTLIRLDEGIIRKASFGFNTIKAQPLPSKKHVRQLMEVKHHETSVLTRLSANPKAGIEMVKKDFKGVVLELKDLAPDEQKFLQDMLGMHTDNLSKMVEFAGRLPVESDLYTTAQYWVGRLNDFVGDMKSQIRWNGVRDSSGKVITVKQGPTHLEIKERLENLQKFVRNTKASDACILEAMDEIKSLGLLLEVDTADTRQDAGEPSVSAEEVKALSDALEFSLFKIF